MLPIRRIQKNRQIPLNSGYSERTRRIESILIHSTNNPEGNTTFKDELLFLATSKAVTSEYLVGANDIVELLDPFMFYGYHAGAVRNLKYSNARSIGIETHYSPKDTKPVDSRTLDNLTELVQHLLAVHHLTPNDISLHHLEALPVGRKSDPNFWNAEQFETWKQTLIPMESFTVLQETPIYTEPELQTRATHINTGDIVNGVLPIGFTFSGQRLSNSLWLMNGWGFIPLWAIEGYTILNGLHVDSIYLHRALNTWAGHLTTPQKDSIVSAFTAYGEVTDIGNLFPFAQAAKETGWFASERWKKSFNPAGLGATDDGAWGGHFETASSGIFAQYAHLLCYAAPEQDLNYIQRAIALLSPRRDALIGAYGLGVARNSWQGLSLKWNSPKGNKNYGQEIIVLGEKIIRL
jgi:hypothetical protein